MSMVCSNKGGGLKRNTPGAGATATGTKYETKPSRDRV